MGAAISSIRDTLVVIAAAVRTFSSLIIEYRQLLTRMNQDPGLPVPNPTSSYWLDDPPFPDLVDVQGDLPLETDVVIIGSGIAGVAAAKAILELSSARNASAAGKNPRVVVLEARELCSGATGRNGGHIKCVPYDVFAQMRKIFKGDTERAKRIVKFQLGHLKYLMELGRDHPAGEVRHVETVDMFLETKDFERAKGEVMELRRWMPEIECCVWERDEAISKFGCNVMNKGAISYNAGALWPYRLVTGLWNNLLEHYPDQLVISTHSPVSGVAGNTSPSSFASAASHPYAVTSSRGIIKARHVLHATNAFATNLNPLFRGRLTGALAHMTAQRPGADFPPSHDGSRSWSIIYSPGFDYITQRPDDQETGAPGDIMLGGRLVDGNGGGLDHVGRWDDSQDTMEAFSLMHLCGSMSAVFQPRWGLGGGMKKAWTGIISLTGDMMPFVGRIPDDNKNGTAAPRSSNHDPETAKAKTANMGAPGQWIAAGFNGEGMVWAWLCGTAIAVMMLGLDEEALAPGVGRPGGKLEDWFPREELGISAARLKRADLTNLAGEVT